MSGLIWVQTVCKGYQQTTKVRSSWEIVKTNGNPFQGIKKLFSRLKNAAKPSSISIILSVQNISTIVIAPVIWTQLFKTKCILKLLSLNMAYMLIFLLKNVSSFCICKSYSHFFSKNSCELEREILYLLEQLTF